MNFDFDYVKNYFTNGSAYRGTVKWKKLHIIRTLYFFQIQKYFYTNKC